MFQVEMYGLPCDTVRRERKFKTRTVLNGLNPIFRNIRMKNDNVQLLFDIFHYYIRYLIKQCSIYTLSICLKEFCVSCTNIFYSLYIEYQKSCIPLYFCTLKPTHEVTSSDFSKSVTRKSYQFYVQ